MELFLSRGCFLPPDIICTVTRRTTSCASEDAPWIITRLLECGASANWSTPCGGNPLHHVLCVNIFPLPLALNLMQLRVAKLLVEAGCNPRSKNNSGITPLIHALRHRNSTMVSYLIEQCALFTDSDTIHFIDVDWAKGLPWYDLASTAICAAKHSRTVMTSLTLADVHLVHIMLRRRFKLPSRITGVILDFAQYWACYTAVKGGTIAEESVPFPFAFLRPAPRGTDVVVQCIEFVLTDRKCPCFCRPQTAH